MITAQQQSFEEIIFRRAYFSRSAPLLRAKRAKVELTDMFNSFGTWIVAKGKSPFTYDWKMSPKSWQRCLSVCTHFMCPCIRIKYKCVRVSESNTNLSVYPNEKQFVHDFCVRVSESKSFFKRGQNGIKCHFLKGCEIGSTCRSLLTSNPKAVSPASQRLWAPSNACCSCLCHAT